MIKSAASTNNRPLPERPIGEESRASHLPQVEFSDRRKYSLHGAPSSKQDDILGVMKKQSIVIANTHSDPSMICNVEAVKQVCNWPSLSDSADGADVGVATANVTSGDYIEMTQGRLILQISPGGTFSTYTHGEGSVQEIFKQPKNITATSLQPKNISSFYT